MDEMHKTKSPLILFLFVCLSACYVTACQSTLTPGNLGEADKSAASANDLLIVDCLLPGTIQQLGQYTSYVSHRRPVKTTAADCRIRGGEYTAYDRSNYVSARNVWQADAERGNPAAQNYLGQIYERGLGIKPDYQMAVLWYRRAAEQGNAPAMINLGKMYEQGLGVKKNINTALQWYRRAAGLPDLMPSPQLQLNSPGNPGNHPVIQLFEPDVPPTRGLLLVRIEPQIRKQLIKGRVLSRHGLKSLTVNNKPVKFDKNRYFQTLVSMTSTETHVRIIAIDNYRHKAERDFVLNRTAPIRNTLQYGKYYALIIGDNKYQHLNALSTAIHDADSLAKVLRDEYGFTVTTLHNATRYQILNNLNRLRRTLNQDDNLLIYYAGHGQIDKVNDRGNWLPVDAEFNSTTNWISNVAITDILNAMSARHILVVVDSCYSGTLTRSVLTELRPGQTDQARAAYYRAIAKKRSRTALTSGGIAPVLDSGSNNHSVFANALLMVLKQNHGVLEGQQLFIDVAAQVTKAAYDRRFEQIPQYAPIKFAGHEAGDFLLIPK